MYTYASDGTRNTFVPGVPTFQPSQPVLAPAGFGTFGGELIVANSAGREVIAFTPSGTPTVIASPFVSPFGLAFAPTGFGGQGGSLFVSNGAGNQIDIVRGDGTFSPFATIPLLPGQTALRQLAFAPAGFIPGFGSLLFVSVSGSASGGGTLGDILGLDSNGTIVTSLRSNLGLTKFDPRGMLFTSGGLLISDASDPIYLATSSDFLAPSVPEPTTLTMFTIGLIGMLSLRARGLLSSAA
jgi:hypothetical protein